MKKKILNKYNRKGKNNNNFKHGKSFKKSNCIDCGIELAIHAYYYGHKRCKKCAYLWKIKMGILKGKNNPMFDKHHTKKTKIKISKTKIKNGDSKGRKNPHFGIPTSHGKRIYYKGICMRSSWETLFAQFLNLSGYKYLYEPKTFDLGNITYTPDFYIPEWDLYIEIKGYWRDNTRKRFNLFKKKYSNIKVLMKKDLQELGVFNK